jgi:glutamate-1-semialdehyde 2,1-aminomutase
MRETSFDYNNKMKNLTPGGVSSPVRAFDPGPVFFSEGKGCNITDVDGNEYVDLCMAYGPLILGHSHPSVVTAMEQQIRKGTVFGAPSVPEMDLISEISKRVPCAEMVRLVNSGTEAVMHTVRLARGYTGRKGIVKMKGGFHGSSDAVLWDNARATPRKGIPQAVSADTYVAEYNSIENIESVLEANLDIAAVIMEPVLGNAGVVPPEKDYLKKMRKITEQEGVLLIFDEVITGFRLAAGGAQELFGVTPDLCTLGKIMGGGLPAGAIAGRREIMENLAPAGPVYQAGTFSGNPMTAAAGLATLGELTKERYKLLDTMTSGLVASLRDALADKGVTAAVNAVGSMFQMFFGRDSVKNGTEAAGGDKSIYMTVFREMLDSGVYMPPDALEVNFMSTEHGTVVGDISETFSRCLGCAV